MKVLIVGFGYVGTALAALLEHKGYQVGATTRDVAKLKTIEELGYEAYLIEKGMLPPLGEFDILCLTLGASNKEEYELTYKQTAQLIASQNPSCKAILYTSSTSVYLERSGGIVNEDSPQNTEDFSSRILCETENILLSMQNEKRNVCVFRLGEIYGPGREISSRMEKNHFKWGGDGNRYTNMIHVDDICHAFLFAIEHKLSGVYNLVDDDHFLRKDLFDLVSRKFDLFYVEFTGEAIKSHGGNKRVSNLKLKKQGFHWKHPLRILC